MGGGSAKIVPALAKGELVPHYTSVHFNASIQMHELTSASSLQPLHKYLAPSPGWMLCRDCGGGRDDGGKGGIKGEKRKGGKGGEKERKKGGTPKV